MMMGFFFFLFFRFLSVHFSIIGQFTDSVTMGLGSGGNNGGGNGGGSGRWW